MRKSELFDKCVSFIEDLRVKRKLHLKHPYPCPASSYFPLDKPFFSGIAVSTVEGEAGIITRAWGVVFVNPDHPLRCTEVHNSFYGESVALGKLFRELESLKLDNKVERRYIGNL